MKTDDKNKDQQEYLILVSKLLTCNAILRAGSKEEASDRQ